MTVVDHAAASYKIPPRPRRRWPALAGAAVLAIGILGAGVGGMQWLVATSPKPEPIAPERPALPVTVQELRRETVIEPILGFGTARSDQQTAVAAQVSGQVVFRAPELEQGALVAGGTVVLRIDPRDYAARVEQVNGQLQADEALLRQLETETGNIERLLESARGDFDAARREYERVRSLLETNNSNPRELDATRRVYEQSRGALITLENQLGLLPDRGRSQAAMLQLRRAELQMAKLDLERCEISLPFDGQIENVQAEVGGTVAPGEPLFSVLDPRMLEVPIELPVSLFSRVRVGSPCELRQETGGDVLWRGQVRRLSASADVATRTFAAYVMVDNAQQAEPLSPGMFVSARIDGPTLTDALIVPRECVQRGSVFVLRDHTAVRVPVQVERRLVERCVISGVEPGERVITSNLSALFDGAHVRVREQHGHAEYRETMPPAVPPQVQPALSPVTLSPVTPPSPR